MSRRALVGLFLILTACEEAKPLTPEDYVVRIDEVWCDRYAECGGAGSAELCRDHYEGRVGDLDVYLEHLAAGRMTFDPARAAECLRALERASCAAAVGLESALSVDYACYQAFAPAQEAGQPCTQVIGSSFFSQCRPGLSCQAGPCEWGQCCEGTCVEREGRSRAEDERCESAWDCRPGLICSRAGRCSATPAEGDACVGSCVGDLVCIEEICAPAPAVVSGVTTCRGDTCDTGRCDANHYCDDSGLCQALHGRGEACGPELGWCDWYHECSSETGRCEPRRPIGAACAEDKQCIGTPGRCREGRCVAPRTSGETCADPDDCASGVCGTDGTCWSWPVCPAITPDAPAP